MSESLILQIRQYILNKAKQERRELISFDDVCSEFNLSMSTLKSFSKYVCQYLLTNVFVEDVDIVDYDYFAVMLKNSRIRCRG